ncbi:MAG: hypothetical protein HUK26_06785, partial [Duodenibacillus sp.]|nr:hypothetical protein [Duodenibacillus sp.]
ITHPGDIFVVRVVASVVPAAGRAAGRDAVMAAVEYGVKHLKVKHLIVLGHSNCGGVFGLMHPEKIAEDAFVLPWVSHLEEAHQRLQESLQGELGPRRSRLTEEACALQSTANLLSYDWIRERVACHALHLHTWYFDLGEGDLLAYDAAKESFVQLQHWSAGGMHRPDAEPQL